MAVDFFLSASRMRNQGFGASVAVLGTDMINSKWLPQQPGINTLSLKMQLLLMNSV